MAVDRKVWTGTGKLVVVKTPEGELGIMANHEPVLSLLVNGVVRIETSDNQKVAVAVHGGFVAVDSNNVRVLAEVAELGSDVDVDRARAALARAKEAGLDSPEELAAAHRAESRLKAAASHSAAALHG